MKTLALSLLVLSSASLVHADPVKYEYDSLPRETAKMDAATFEKAILLGQNVAQDIKVRLTIQDMGQSTDVSPRYMLMLTYRHSTEEYNTQTAFLVGNAMDIKTLKTKRVAAGVYQVEFNALADGGQIVRRKVTIDTAQVFADDRAQKPQGFENIYFASKIKLTE